MKDFLKQLLPQNYPFFASLFQAELLKHVLNADEFDKQLAELTDPTKLRKLNQRMTERRADNSQNYSAKQKNNNGGGNANFNNSTRPFPQQYRHKGVMYYNANTPNTNTKGQFKIRPDKEVRRVADSDLKKFNDIKMMLLYRRWKRIHSRDYSLTRRRNSFRCCTRSITIV